LTEALAFIKLSLLFQYLRIFKRGTWTYRASILAIVFVSLWNLAFSIMAWVPCTNVSDAWNVFDTNRHCWATASSNPTDFTASLVIYTVMNMLMDLFITTLPFPLYFQPDATFATRVGLLALLVMGATVNICSIWRLQDTIYHNGANYPTRDPTWYGPLSILLAVLEVNIASICASIPVFWVVLRPYLGFILVTREIKINREDRDDGPHSKSSKSSDGRTGSEAELNAHYNDVYVMDHVDPLRDTGTRAVQSQVGADTVTYEKRRWYRF